MKAAVVTEGIYRVAANIYEEHLFEGMWPIPHGVSLNSYIVKGGKCALIDGGGTWKGVPEELLSQLDELNISLDDIDYMVLNHLEPDHTGWLEILKQRGKKFSIYTSQKGASLMSAFFGIEDNLHVVKSGDTLDLGQGMSLVFEETPNIHWPETIMTYEPKTGTLFSCDGFGSYGAVEDKVFDDQLNEEELKHYEYEALRYYANIVSSFSAFVIRGIEKFKDKNVRIIAPSHGIVWRKNPRRILDDYIRYASYSQGPAKPAVTVIWSSMYGMTARAVEPLVEGLKEGGVEVFVHQIPETHVSFVLASVWQSTGVVVGMPTYEYKMFPPMASVLDDLGRKKAVGKKAFRFGSFGWSGGAQKELDEIMERNKMRWEFIEPVEFNGSPRDSDLKLIRQRGKELAELVKQSV